MVAGFKSTASLHKRDANYVSWTEEINDFPYLDYVTLCHQRKIDLTKSHKNKLTFASSIKQHFENYGLLVNSPHLITL